MNQWINVGGLPIDKYICFCYTFWDWGNSPGRSLWSIGPTVRWTQAKTLITCLQAVLLWMVHQSSISESSVNSDPLSSLWKFWVFPFLVHSHPRNSHRILQGRLEGYLRQHCRTQPLPLLRSCVLVKLSKKLRSPTVVTALHFGPWDLEFFLSYVSSSTFIG